MLKVLNLIDSMDPKQGGPPEAIRNLKRSLNKKKKIIYVLSVDNFSFLQILKFIFYKKSKLKICKFINKFDILHCHSIWNYKIILLAQISNSLGLKVIFSSHGYLDDWSLRRSIIKKKIFLFLILNRLLLNAKLFFSNIGEYNESKKKIKFGDVFVIPNGIDTSLYKKLVQHQKVTLKKKIIYFGRIHKKKGIEIFLEAIKEMPDNFFENYFFEITGPGEKNYVSKIREMIKKFKIEKFVSIEKPKSSKEKINYLQNADIFVLPSYEEGDSIALKEAMSASNMVIISEQCRLPIVEKENAGFIIKTSKESIKNALKKLKYSNLSVMGENSKKIISKYFENDICSNRVLKIYEDIHTGAINSNDWLKKNG